MHVEIYLGPEGGSLSLASTARDEVTDASLLERSIGSRSGWHYDHPLTAGASKSSDGSSVRSRLVRETVALRAKGEEGAGLSGVQVYSSFRTKGDRWLGPVAYHYRSIVPWLRGEGALPPDVAMQLEAQTPKGKMRQRIAQLNLGGWSISD